jgi:hypothetical protein
MPTIYCRHIRPSGRRCQSFALRGKPFCYHHESVNAHLRTLHPPADGTENILHPMNLSAEKFQREPILAEYFSKTRAPLELRFPTLEDADSIQLSLSMLLTALGQNRIDLKRASGMIYALQVAAANVRNTTHDAPHTVTEILTDDAGNLMSTDEDPEEIVEDELETQRILEAIQQEQDEQDDSDDEDDYEDDEDDEDDKAAHSRRMRYTIKLFQETCDSSLPPNSNPDETATEDSPAYPHPSLSSDAHTPPSITFK